MRNTTIRGRVISGIMRKITIVNSAKIIDNNVVWNVTTYYTFFKVITFWRSYTYTEPYR